MVVSRPRVLAILPGFIPSTVITVVQPLLDLDREGFLHSRITIERLAGKRDIEWADLVIFTRNVNPKNQPLLDLVFKKNVSFVYDLDDNLFDIPEDTALGRYHHSEDVQAMMARFVQEASLMRVYSDVMYQRCLPLNPNTVQVAAAIDWRQIKRPDVKNRSGKVKIVYATSRTEDELIKIFMPAVQQILSDYPERVDFYLWGTFSSVPKLHGITIIPTVSNYNKFLSRFSQFGFDIGLAPLVDDVFHQAKTNNKFREYSACRIAGIYSDVEVYRSCVENNMTGLLVGNRQADWYQALSRLINEPALRDGIKEQAFTYTRKHYSQETFNLTWKNQISALLDCASSKTVRSNETLVRTINPRQSQNSERKPYNDRLPAADPGSLQYFVRNILFVLARLWREGIPGITAFIRWFVFTFWSLLKVNVAKKL